MNHTKAMHRKHLGTLGEVAVAKTIMSFDTLAIYLPESDQVAYLKSEELQRSIALRVAPTKNNQQQGINWFCDYTSLERVLRDHEQDTSAGKAGGEDMVQTTTERAHESECGR